MLTVPRDPMYLGDLDEWWVERRLLARKLLDTNAAPKAYRIVRDAAPPTTENLRVEHEFMAGWIGAGRSASSGPFVNSPGSGHDSNLSALASKPATLVLFLRRGVRERLTTPLCGRLRSACQQRFRPRSRAARGGRRDRAMRCRARAGGEARRRCRSFWRQGWRRSGRSRGPE